MHYILNTTFRAPGGGFRQPIGGPTRFNNLAESQTVGSKDFEPGELYVLVYIKKLDEKVEYTFKSSKGKIVTQLFQSCNDADMFIAKMRNEILPDYESFYKNLKN